MNAYLQKCTFAQFNDACAYTGIYGSNNWTAAAARATGIAFFFHGTWDENTNCNSRTAIKAGTFVEVDYVVFGSTIDQLKAYTSNIEDAGQKTATPD